MRRSILLAACAALQPAGALACQPPSPAAYEYSPARVKANFDGARFVVLARLTGVRDVSVTTGEPAFTTRAERASFRVERVFKGKVKRGDTFHVDSGLTSCGRGVRDGGWVPFIPDGKARPPAPVPGRWLIYYMPLPAAPSAGPPLFEIDGSPRARPAQQASYDLEVLAAQAGRWRAAP